MSKITVIGTGYVGLVTGSCLSDFGHKITCVDNDKKKIARLLKGEIPIYEPGLEAIVERNAYYGRLSFTTDTAKAVGDSEVIFIAVGTPPADDGSADLQYVEAVAREIARAMDGYRIIVDKSTVPIGTGSRVRAWVQEELDKRGADYEFDVVSNPEFLREGSAVRDFTHPDRIVIGTESEKARDTMRQVYRVLYLNETPFIETNIETAEMIKYSANAFLAMKITFINEVANLSEKVGANVQDVARAMGRDGRISPKFLHPGPGYGGSCFPKDTKALAEIGKDFGERISLIEKTIEANENQKLKMVKKIKEKMVDLKGKKIGVLGLTFKPNTDEMREASSLVILPELVRMGASIKVFDPEGMVESQWRLKAIEDSVEYCSDEYAAISDCDALVILTEWNQFRSLDLEKVKSLMKDHFFFDFRNIYNRRELEDRGFVYDCI